MRGMAAPQTEVLITVDGSERGRYLFKPGDYIIGREEGCHIRVEAELVSRRHAKLVLNYDHAVIEDLGSANGTRVNVAAGDGRRSTAAPPPTTAGGGHFETRNAERGTRKESSARLLTSAATKLWRRSVRGGALASPPATFRARSAIPNAALPFAFVAGGNSALHLRQQKGLPFLAAALC